MYHYVEDKKFLSRMRSLCGEIMQDLCHCLNKKYDIGANVFLVGSGASNLILQNESQPIDLDYNIEIVRCEDYEDCRFIKECVIKAFNEVLCNHGWGDCKDSKSSLTTEKSYFTKGNPTGFSMDVCIVCRDTKGNFYRLIHEKTNVYNIMTGQHYDRYYWNKAFDSAKINEKAKYIKKMGEWGRVRKQYRDIKNRYLTQNDQDHPSFICYIEAVNNVYNEIKNWK